MKNFAGKVAVVTGAASGIGRALVVEPALRGSRLAISDIDVSGLEETATLCRSQGAEIHSHRLDVADLAAFESYAAVLVHDYRIGVSDFQQCGDRVLRRGRACADRRLPARLRRELLGSRARYDRLPPASDRIRRRSASSTYPVFSGWSVRRPERLHRVEIRIREPDPRVGDVDRRTSASELRAPGRGQDRGRVERGPTEGADRTVPIEGFERRPAIHSPRSAAESISASASATHGFVGAEVKALDGLAPD